VLADGSPWEVLTPETLRSAFDLEAMVIPDPSSGSPLVVPTVRTNPVHAFPKAT